MRLTAQIREVQVGGKGRVFHFHPSHEGLYNPLNPKVSTRLQNEKKFGQWNELAGGGRRYWLDVAGRSGWRARYFKEVNASEATIRFWQEIYNETGKLVEIHEKFPLDKGHRQV